MRWTYIYIDGKLEGEAKEWWETGDLREHSFYRDGEEYGCQLFYNVDGLLVERKHMYKGKLCGEYKTWDGRGRLLRDSYYNDGEVDDLHNHQWDYDWGYSSIVKTKWSYHKQNRNEARIYDKTTDVLLEYAEYHAYSLDGVFKRWYYNENPRVVTHYRKGIVDGVYKEWDHTGKLVYYKYYMYAQNIIDWSHDQNGVANMTLKVVMSLLYFKHRLRKLVKSQIRKRYLDDRLIHDLGNIVMMYYIKTE